MKKSYSLEYNKTKECEILIFGDDLKFWSFSRWNIEILRNLHVFLNSCLFNNDWKKNLMHSGNFKYFFKKLQKNSFKNSIACKRFFWRKMMCSPFPK
jgi:hypothetical protein